MAEKLNLKQAVEKLGVSAGLIRKAVHDHEVSVKLHSYDEEEPIVGLAATKNSSGHLEFEPADLDAFKNRVKRTGGSKGDGKKYLVRLTAAEVEEFKSLFPGKELADPYAYNKAYQKAAKERAAAEAVE